MSVKAVTRRERTAEFFTENVTDNPIVGRELRARMRGWKAFATMAVYVVAVGVVMFMTYDAYAPRFSSSGGWPYSVDRPLGMILFVALTWTQAALLAFLIPALSYGSIAAEIEKKTIEMLALSGMTAGRVVLGKQLASFGFVLMLLVSSAPIAAICLLFGGLSPAEIAVTYIVLVVWSFMMCAACVLLSSMFARTSNAAGTTYGTCILFMLISLLVIGGITNGGRPASGFFVFTHLNPGWAAMSALDSARVMNFPVPLALAGVVVMAGIGCLMLLLASTHVRHLTTERALSIRLLLLALSALIIVLLYGNYGALSTSAWAGPQAIIRVFASTLLVVLCLAAAAVATGPLRKPPAQPAADYALSGRRAFRGDIGGAATFMSLWWIAAYGSFGAVLFPAVRLSSSPAGLPGPPATPPDVLTGYISMGIAGLAVIFAVSCFGVLASALSPQRQAAAALVLVFVAAIFLGYAFLLIGRTGANNDSPIWHLAALWPLTPMFAADSTFWPGTWQKTDLAWIATTCVYVGIAVLWLSLANIAARGCKGVQEE